MSLTYSHISLLCFWWRPPTFKHETSLNNKVVFFLMFILPGNSVFTSYPVTGKMNVEESNLSDFNQWPTALGMKFRFHIVAFRIPKALDPDCIWISRMPFSFSLCKLQSNINLNFLYHNKLIPISTPLHLLLPLPGMLIY